MVRQLSTFAAAQLLQVDPGSVANWIDRGMLKAHRTPGGHRRIIETDLVVFLREHRMPVPPELASVETRILVVGGTKSVTGKIGRALEGSGRDCEVIEASDAFSAGAIVATFRPDVIILDLPTHGVEACEMCRQIKSSPQTRHVAILVVMDVPSVEAVQRIIECGAAGCLPKPLDISLLLGKVSGLC